MQSFSNMITIPIIRGIQYKQNKLTGISTTC